MKTQANLLSICIRRFWLIGVTSLLLTTAASKKKKKVLYSFSGGSDGFWPNGVTFDSAGNLFGTTQQGGVGTSGTVFELSPKSGGGWTLKVLHSFTGGADGGRPYSGVVMDATGNLYGSTFFGGDFNKGVVYRVSPNTDGSWTETVLHSFSGGVDGAGPYDTPIFDAAGNLYGTTFNGGATYNTGTVFQLTPNSDDTWSEKILFTFTGQQNPVAGLVMDSAGNFYGATVYGGPQFRGNVYQLTQTSGTWTQRILHIFTGGNDSQVPYAGLVRDAAGNLYGAAYGGGGAAAWGAIYRLSPGSTGNWNFKVIYTFTGLADGGSPYSALALDRNGSLYGTADHGASFNCSGGCGSVFKLARSGGGFTESSLYSFNGGLDGANPYSSLVFDADGNVYGTAYGGGASLLGVIYEVKP